MDKQELFSDLIRQCGDSAYNFAFRLTGNASDAGDLAQEAFLKALKNISSYDPNKPFQPWLNRILHNLYIDGIRHYEKRHVVSMDAPSPADDAAWEEILPERRPGPVDELHQSELEEVIQKALGRLELEYRTAVILSDMEGLSYEEISRIMDCPIGTVRSRIHRGRAMMKQWLKPYIEKGETGEVK